jgi:preprotein translocase subunit YajC
MILIFVAFYFLLIAPQRKKQKQHEKMIQSLEKGAKVKTIIIQQNY